jgi:hypothetical protein
MKLEITNQTITPVNVTLEPIGDSFDIPVGTMGEVKLDGQETVRLDIYAENHINIWTDGEVIVSIGEDKMKFSAIL